MGSPSARGPMRHTHRKGSGILRGWPRLHARAPGSSGRHRSAARDAVLPRLRRHRAFGNAVEHLVTWWWVGRRRCGDPPVVPVLVQRAGTCVPASLLRQRPRLPVAGAFPPYVKSCVIATASHVCPTGAWVQMLQIGVAWKDQSSARPSRGFSPAGGEAQTLAQ